MILDGQCLRFAMFDVLMFKWINHETIKCFDFAAKADVHERGTCEYLLRMCDWEELSWATFLKRSTRFNVHKQRTGELRILSTLVINTIASVKRMSPY